MNYWINGLMRMGIHLGNMTGMTTANMKLVTLRKTFTDDLELTHAKLDEGEHIVKRVVPLAELYDVLNGE